MVITSPPYGKQRDYSDIPEDLGNISLDEGGDIAYAKVFSELYRVLKDEGSVYLNIGDFHVDGCLANYPYKLKTLAEEAGFCHIDTIIWSKTNFKNIISERIFNPSYEFIFRLVKNVKTYTHNQVMAPTKDGEIKIASRPYDYNRDPNVFKSHYVTTGMRRLSDFWDGESVIKLSGVNKNIFKKYGIDLVHPATFPELLPVIPILQSSNEDDIIMDCFSGAGTTGVAALKLFRKYIGIDINPNFIEKSREVLNAVILNRINDDQDQSEEFKQAA